MESICPFSDPIEKELSILKIYQKLLTKSLKNQFFLVFEYRAFLITLGSPGSINAMLFRQYFYWNLSFCGPQVEGIPRSAISIDFPLCCNSIFYMIASLNSFTKASIWFIPRVKEVLPRKTGCYVSCVTITIVWKIWWKANIIDISFYSTWISSATPGSSSSIKISI